MGWLQPRTALSECAGITLGMAAVKQYMRDEVREVQLWPGPNKELLHGTELPRARRDIFDRAEETIHDAMIDRK